jgi:electron transfer flavoprotein beta subunit
MNIVVPIKQVPDLVEELEIDSSGKDLNREWLKNKVSEFDDHALEEALLYKEANGGTVTAIALDSDGIDKALHAAAAKGADKVVKVTGDFGVAVSTHTAGKAMADAIQSLGFDVVMTGVQAVDDRDGQIAGIIAGHLAVANVNVITSVSKNGDGLIVQKEYGGGVVAEFEVGTPVVLGIQAAKETPRYIPVAKIRKASRGATIEEVAGSTDGNAGSEVTRMFKPEGGQGAEMLGDDAEAAASRIVEILNEKGIK